MWVLLVILIIGLLPTVFVSAENAEKTEKDNQTATSTKNLTAAVDLQSLIEKLQNQIKELQEQLAKLKTDVEEVKEELKLTKNLYKGLSDEEVKKLQGFLKQYVEVYPEGLVTGYYGPLTEKAVKKFQEKYDIPTTGLVGPMTREKIKELSSEKKVIVCHYPPENPSNKHSLEIGESALEAHLAHGDSLGACPQEPALTVPTPTTPSPTTPTPTPSTPTPLATTLGCYGVTSAAAASPTSIPITSALGCNGVTSITDNRDTNNPVYETVEIGNQCWLKRNLNIGTYVTGTATQTNNGVIEKYCYGNITANCDTYGGLYQYDEAVNYYSAVPTETDVIQGICPVGWHIPRDSEWNTLVAYLGGESVAGDKMKNFGFSPWYDTNITKNSSGFTAYGAGHRDHIGRFNSLGAVAFFWSSLSGDATNASYRHINSDESALHRVCYSRSSGVSVRCIKD